MNTITSWIIIWICVISIWWVAFAYNSWIFSQKIPVKNTTELNTKNLKNAYFAWGCFWCMESIFEKQAGVEWAYAWYTGWSEETATYEQTSAKNTKHREAIKVVYDPNIISYEILVQLALTQLDPTDSEGQFNDRGFVYSPAIFYNNDEEKIIAQKIINDLSVSRRFSEPIVVSVEPAKKFFLAEEYHQDYYKKNPVRYKLYTSGSGRKEFIEENWSDKIEEIESSLQDDSSSQETSLNSPLKGEMESQFSQEELREKLTPLQYRVTQEDGTEPAFNNAYWDNKENGIYVDIIDGTPLYSSLDKFDSGTGWPSFTKWINEENLETSTDTRFFMTRTEVSSATSWAHLGHIFNDAPKELWGIRHCINSASLRFIPVEDLEGEGYGEYVEIFE